MDAADITLAHIETEAQDEYLPLLGQEQCAFLEWLMREKRPRHALDLGALVGYSSIRLGRAIPALGAVTAVEISKDLARRAAENARHAGMGEKVRVVLGDARDSALHLPGPFDFVLIDAERSQYLNLLKRFESRLAPQATIVAARTGGRPAHGLRDYLEYVRSSPRFASMSRMFGTDAMEVSTLLA